MKIQTATSMPNIYVLFGYPINFTLSPIIHNAIFSKNNENSIYFAQPIKANKIKSALQSMKDFNWKGANVTIPYKQSVIEFLDVIDVSAKKIGAVNTILNDNNKLIGYNTDFLGFKHTIPQELNKEKPIICLGAGGAALAIVSALVDSGFKDISIINRTESKAKDLVGKIKNNFNQNVSIILFNNVTEQHLNNKELIINCTPVNFPLPELNYNNILKNISCVYDLRYGIKNNKFIQLAKTNGSQYIFDGLQMLIWQALYAQKIWNGSLPNYNIVEEVLKEWL